MNEGMAGNTKVGLLAKQLRVDMERRALRVGDHYLTAAQAGEMLGVSHMMANRAMNILAERNLLVRHRSRGTFVGPAFGEMASKATKCIHYVGFMDDDPQWSPPLGQILTGLRRVLPEARLNCHHLPFQNAVRHIREEVERIAAEDSFGGIVVTYCPREVQEYLADTGLPVVVYGSTYPGIPLPCLDMDQKQVGRLLVELAVRAGCVRMVFVGRENWRHGDAITFDGILEAVHNAKLGPDAIRIRNVGIDSRSRTDVLVPLIRDLAENPRQPAALLCRSARIARDASEAAVVCGVGVPRDLRIVYNAGSVGDRSLPYPCVLAKESAEKQFTLIGRMLSRMAQGEASLPQSVVIPVVANGEVDS